MQHSREPTNIPPTYAQLVFDKDALEEDNIKSVGVLKRELSFCLRDLGRNLQTFELDFDELKAIHGEQEV